MVRRSKVFRWAIDESPCQDGAASDPAKEGTSVEAQIAFHLGVRQRDLLPCLCWA